MHYTNMQMICKFYFSFSLIFLKLNFFRSQSDSSWFNRFVKDLQDIDVIPKSNANQQHNIYQTHVRKNDLYFLFIYFYNFRQIQQYHR